MNARTYSAPPDFLRAIPDKLLTRQKNPVQDLRRAVALLRHCEKAGFRPNFLDLHLEGVRRR